MHLGEPLRRAGAPEVRPALLASGYPLHHLRGAFRPATVVPLLSLSQQKKAPKSKDFGAFFINLITCNAKFDAKNIGHVLLLK
jgi:hypothetical protein